MKSNESLALALSVVQPKMVENYLFRSYDLSFSQNNFLIFSFLGLSQPFRCSCIHYGILFHPTQTICTSKHTYLGEHALFIVNVILLPYTRILDCSPRLQRVRVSRCTLVSPCTSAHVSKSSGRSVVLCLDRDEASVRDAASFLFFFKKRAKKK